MTSTSVVINNNIISKMAEESGGDSWWGAWGTEFLSNVKAKSAETLTLVKQDLSEFVTTIQHDTTVTVAETAANVKEKLKVEEDETDGSTTAVIRQGVSQWLGSLSTALRENVSQMTAIVDEEPTSSEPAPVFDRIQARVHEIQTDPSTYCNDPDGHPAHFEEWREKFDLEQHKAEISELLVNRPEIRSLYTKLVPAAVTNYLFWTRYFYKIHQFDQEEKRKAALVERANKMEEEDIGWDDEDDSWDIEESSSKDLAQSSSIDKLIYVESGISVPASKLEEESQEDKEDFIIENESKTPTPEDETKAVGEEQVKPLETKDQTELSGEKEMEDEKATEEFSEGKHPGTEKPMALPLSQEKLPLPDKTASLPNNEKKDEPRQSSTPQPCVEEIQPTASESIKTESDDHLNRENSSNSSVDSSWSKLSEEDLKQNNGIKTEKGQQDNISSHQKAPSPSHSERSSSSLVVITPVQEKDIDIDWDDDDDDDDDATSANKDAIKSTEMDDDDDDWENWE